MDLNIYDTNEASNTGTFMHLEAPNGELLYSDDDKHEPVGMTLLGADSRKLRDLANKQQDRYLKAMRVKRGRVNTGMSSEQSESDNLALLAAAVLSFHNMEFNGKALVVDDAHMVLSELSWVREQVTAHINDTEAYLGEVARS
jgi:hypothetical protein